MFHNNVSLRKERKSSQFVIKSRNIYPLLVWEQDKKNVYKGLSTMVITIRFNCCEICLWIFSYADILMRRVAEKRNTICRHLTTFSNK